jgi:hypothetical protein
MSQDKRDSFQSARAARFQFYRKATRARFLDVERATTRRGSIFAATFS